MKRGRKEEGGREKEKEKEQREKEGGRKRKGGGERGGVGEAPGKDRRMMHVEKNLLTCLLSQNDWKSRAFAGRTQFFIVVVVAAIAVDSEHFSLVVCLWDWHWLGDSEC